MDIDTKTLLADSWACGRRNAGGLLRVALPWLAAGAIIDGSALALPIDDVVVYAVQLVGGLLIGAGLVLSAFRHLLNGIGAYPVVTARTVRNHLLATLPVVSATAFGLTLFVLPGLVVAASCALFPLLILDRGCGPVHAILGSMALMRDQWARLALCLLAFALAGGALSDACDYAVSAAGLPVAIDALMRNVGGAALGLATFPLIFTIYRHVTRPRSADTAPAADAPHDGEGAGGAAPRAVR